MFSLYIWMVLIPHVITSEDIKFGIRTSSTEWTALSYLKLTLFSHDSRYQCVINASYANINTIYQCDTSDTQTTYQCDTDANDVPFGLQIDENQYQSVIPSFFDEIIIQITDEFSTTDYNIPIATNQIHRYTLFVPNGLNTLQYAQNIGETALCPPVSSTFGFYLDTWNQNAATTDPIRTTLLWEQSRYQCTLFPNVYNPSIYWNCDTSDASNTDECDASINTHSYALHIHHVSGETGAALGRVLIKNKYRNNVEINGYEIERFYTGIPGTQSKCLGRTVYGAIWLNYKAGSCFNGYPHTLLVFNDFYQNTSSRLYDAGSSANCPSPTPKPTSPPTQPSFLPTFSPTDFPSFLPTFSPTDFPSYIPTFLPTKYPSFVPTFPQTKFPSNVPTFSPTFIPTNGPIYLPTYHPSDTPSDTVTSDHNPSLFPSNNPTLNPLITTLNPIKLRTTDGESHHETDEDEDPDKIATTSDDFSWNIAFILIPAVIFFMICVMSAMLCFFGYKIKTKPKYTVSTNKSTTSTVATNVQLEENKDRKLLKEWLQNTVELPIYYDTFIANGYNSLESLQRIQTKADLARVGIHILGHRTKILMDIKELHPNKQKKSNKVDVFPMQNMYEKHDVNDTKTLGGELNERGESQRVSGSVAYAAPFKGNVVKHPPNIDSEAALVFAAPPPPPQTLGALSRDLLIHQVDTNVDAIAGVADDEEVRSDSEEENQTKQ